MHELLQKRNLQQPSSFQIEYRTVMDFYNDDIIKQYLNGLLSKEQVLEIEQKIQLDKGYAQEIEVQRTLIHALKLNESPRLSADIQSFQQSLEAEGFFDNIHQELKLEKEQTTPADSATKTISIFARFKYLGVAAAILILAFFIWPSGQSAPPLFANNFEAYPDIISEAVQFELSTRLLTEEDKRAALLLQKEGLDYYNQQNYSLAIPPFEKCLLSYPEYDTGGEIRFYLAVALVANGETQKAIPALENLLVEKSEIPRADKIWFLALAYLYEEQNEKAKAQLQKLLENNKYQEQANKIMAELK